ncbi:unnamed protein product, partial [Clonostachys chloroleuca]
MSRLRKGLRHKHGLILTTWLREVRVVLVYKFVYDHRGLMRGYAEEGIEEKTKENEDKASMSIALLGDSTVASQVRCNKRACSLDVRPAAAPRHRATGRMLCVTSLEPASPKYQSVTKGKLLQLMSGLTSLHAT